MKGGNRWKKLEQIQTTIYNGPAIRKYLTTVANRRRNNGYVSPSTELKAISASRNFLQFLNRELTEHSLSDLIAETRQQHKNDDFRTDDALLQFVSQKPIMTYTSWGASIKGIFKANRCPLQASFNTTFTHSTRKIGSGVLKGIYDSLTEEQQTVVDLQTYAGERIAALSLTPITQYEDFNNEYTLIHIKAKDTKARNDHICILPKGLADKIRAICKSTTRSTPFPNYQTVWKEITSVASNKFGVRMTSHYLRKRFHTIAGKTLMPINEWDYLMGDKQSYGHNAGTYTLEDFAGLVKDYDKHLAPYLPVENPQEPDEPKEPSLNTTLETLQRENQELKDEILKLTKLLTEKLA
jgi:hypothetical protein